jgi:chromosome segregation ATPase
VLGDTHRELKNTQEELSDTRQALEENRQKLERQTAALEECRVELARALEAQRVNEGVIRELRAEVEKKTTEIDELKRDIQAKDEQMKILTNENRVRVEEVVRDANKRVEDAHSRMNLDQEALADAQRRVGELEATARRTEEAEIEKHRAEAELAKRKADEAEMEKRAAAELAKQRVEEAEVAAQVHLHDEDCMQTDGVSTSLLKVTTELTRGNRMIWKRTMQPHHCP